MLMAVDSTGMINKSCQGVAAGFAGEAQKWRPNMVLNKQARLVGQ